jgi:2-polyprenyl-3-methyl-5-hydroxy-6-metoxy-1,4-benzoquinol methylase
VNEDYYGDPRPDVQALVSAAGSRVLDIGCGSGALGASLKACGASFVAGIEVQPAAAARARERLDALVEGDVLSVDVPFGHGDFDYVVFADVLEHLTDPETAIRRYLPFLAKGGRVIISVPNIRFYTVLARLLLDRWAYTEHGIRDRTHLRVFTRRSLIALHSAVSLEIETLRRRRRLFEDQSHIGRLGALATRVACATIAPLIFPDLMTFQYIAVSRPPDKSAR